MHIRMFNLGNWKQIHRAQMPWYSLVPSAKILLYSLELCTYLQREFKII